MKKLFFVLALAIISLNLKSQTLLNYKKSDIKKYMADRHAILKGGDESYYIGTKPFIQLFYKLPDSIAVKNDIYAMIFSFNKNEKCDKYIAEYRSDKYLKKLINNFDSPGSGFKRLGKDSIWVNTSKGYEVEITYQYKNGRKTNMFVLDTHLK